MTGLKEIAMRSRPLKNSQQAAAQVRDFASAQTVITKTVADDALKRLEIDDIGLDAVDENC